MSNGREHFCPVSLIIDFATELDCQAKSVRAVVRISDHC